jgi:eukaryotic-like serine/threonine-protein kinase
MANGGTAPGPNTVVAGRYQLVRRLGSGGMASVWVARDERLGREVAVKLLSDALAGDREYRRRFEREAKVAARFNHPGLVGIHDFGTESGRPYLVMELVRGDTLADRIGSGRAAELDLASLTRELLDALAYMHAAGVVHRDLKPANVLISEDGRARLTDFGIAQPKDATALTQTGKVVGTLAYLAPEVRRGERASARSDLYSLGLMLRECGGQRDPTLSPLIVRLTAEDPSGRPASTEEARAALDETPVTVPVGETEPTAPLPATAPTKLLRRRRPLLIGLAALGALALALLLLPGDAEEPPVRSTEPVGLDTGPRPEPAPQQGPSAQPPLEPQPSVGAQVDCAQIEARKKAIEEEEKAAEEAAGAGKGQKEAIKARFEERKKALGEQAKACKGDQGEGDGEGGGDGE